MGSLRLSKSNARILMFPPRESVHPVISFPNAGVNRESKTSTVSKPLRNVHGIQAIFWGRLTARIQGSFLGDALHHLRCVGSNRLGQTVRCTPYEQLFWDQSRVSTLGVA